MKIILSCDEVKRLHEVLCYAAQSGVDYSYADYERMLGLLPVDLRKKELGLNAFCSVMLEKSELDELIGFIMRRVDTEKKLDGSWVVYSKNK